MSAPLLTDAQLRAALQLPQRPYSDPFLYDQSPYYDLTQRECVQILTASGTAGGASKQFALNTDFQLTAGTVDWTLPGGTKPDLGTVFTIDYTYSRLGSGASANAIQNAQTIVTQDLGKNFPYGTTTPQGIPADNIALLGQLYIAAREACYALVTSEIENATKIRRGTMQVDDTKKTADWAAAAALWNTRYKQYLLLARGPLHRFEVISANPNRLVFPDDSADLPALYSSILYGTGDYGGVI